MSTVIYLFIAIAVAAQIELPGPQKDMPLVLSSRGQTYKLTRDIVAPGTAIRITERDITLDLNGHTITYDQMGGGVRNPSFEVAHESTGALTAWDTSRATALQRIATSTSPMIGRWCIRIPASANEQTIVSEWLELPPNQLAVAYVARGNPVWRDRVQVRLEVEHEKLGQVAGLYSADASQVRFQTPNEPGRYRLHFSYVPNNWTFWKPNTVYEVGAFVRPNKSNGATYVLESVSNVTSSSSGSEEPHWNTSLGATTRDGALEWITSQIGSVGRNPPWRARHSYSLGTSVFGSTMDGGLVYSLARVNVSDAVSGPTEPDWGDPSKNGRVVDGKLIWRALPDRTALFDQVDLRAVGVHGIESIFYNNTEPTRITIKNGQIIQGQGRNLSSHGIRAGGHEGLVISDLRLTTKGQQSAAVEVTWSSDVEVTNCEVATASAYKFSRHQLSAAINVVNSDNANIRDNNIRSGEGWGGIYLQGTNGTIYGNRVFSQCVITNHFGIMGYGSDHRLFGNKIDCDPGQGLRVQGRRHIVEDNEVVIHSVAPNSEYGRLSLDGIRLNDYYEGYAENNLIRNNRITLYGKNSPYFDREPQILNGIASICNGQGNIYEGNTIQAITVDPEVVVTGIMPGSKDECVIYRKNTIVSDQYCIYFGAYPMWSLNSRFEGNRLVKGPNATESYSVLAGKPRSSTKYVRDTVFCDTILEGGGDLSTVAGPNFAPVDYDVTYSLDVVVNRPDGSPAEEVDVRVADAVGNVVFEGATGQDGRIKTLELSSFRVRYKNGRRTYLSRNPYLVTATFNGDTSVSRNLDLNEPNIIEITLPEVTE